MVIDKSLRQKLSYSKTTLHGELGLIIAIIVQALIDTCDGNEQVRHDALAYFRSATYRQHLSWLDLPEDCQPTI